MPIYEVLRQGGAMRGDSGQFTRPFGSYGLAALAAIAVLAGFLTIGFAPSAQALPSFARQTGQPCGTCHTDFPALTPYGRRFKLMGYTVGGSKFRTTLFPTSEEDKAKPWWPPISTMAIVGYTHSQTPL